MLLVDLCYLCSSYSRPFVERAKDSTLSHIGLVSRETQAVFRLEWLP